MNNIIHVNFKKKEIVPSKISPILFEDVVYGMDRLVDILEDLGDVRELNATNYDAAQLTYLSELCEEFLTHYDRLEDDLGDSIAS